MTDLLNSIIQFFSNIFEWVIDLLPASPFASFEYMTLSNNLLCILNYFFPIAEMILVLQLWIVAVAGYYVYKFILKFIKME